MGHAVRVSPFILKSCTVKNDGKRERERERERSDPKWLFTNVNSLSNSKSDYKFGTRQSSPRCRFTLSREGCFTSRKKKKKKKKEEEEEEEEVEDVRSREDETGDTNGYVDGPRGVTKELMRGELRPQLPNMHNNVWFGICIHICWLASQPQPEPTALPCLRGWESAERRSRFITFHVLLLLYGSANEFWKLNAARYRSRYR